MQNEILEVTDLTVLVVFYCTIGTRKSCTQACSKLSNTNPHTPLFLKTKAKKSKNQQCISQMYLCCLRKSRNCSTRKLHVRTSTANRSNPVASTVSSDHVVAVEAAPRFR
jgi:hypothetical protein